MTTGTPYPKAVDVDKIKGLGEWRALYQAYNAVFKLQELALISQGISLPQLQLLGLLAMEQRPLAISELAIWMVKEPNSLTGLVDRAEAKGWVHTHGDPKDRRKRLVEFTEAGVRKFEEAFNLSNKVAGKIFGNLSASELSQFRAACQKVRDAALGEMRNRPGFKVR
ncbi:MAG: winged helix DNA-binding protein [Dehalococcoidia bacterium]|nr:winged helix DNA-binding protein [Dehalococcoidia bacterium]